MEEFITYKDVLKEINVSLDDLGEKYKRRAADIEKKLKGLKMQQGKANNEKVIKEMQEAIIQDNDEIIEVATLFAEERDENTTSPEPEKKNEPKTEPEQTKPEAQQRGGFLGRLFG